MKKQLAVFAAIAALGVTSALAAHPFSDVTAKDWAYQAVERLAAEGVIEGYPDGTFKGQRNITRYEMAQMIARADAHKDEVTAEQKATIQRLANEFANELQAFGVRVNKLEDKVGNFKFSGDARLRYHNMPEATPEAGKSSFEYRARLKFDSTLDDKTKIGIRLTTKDISFATAKDGGSKNDLVEGAKVFFDEVYVQRILGKHAKVTVGRKDYAIGNGLIYDEMFKGATLDLGNEKLNAVLAHGYIQHNQKSVTSYELKYRPNDTLSVKGFYLDRHSTKYSDSSEKNADIFGGALDITFGPQHKIWVGGEYARKASAKVGSRGDKKTSTSAGEAWIVGVGYGKAINTEPGTWGAKLQYFNFGTDTFVKHTGYKTPTRDENYGIGHSDYKGWLASVDYTINKYLGLSAYATLNSEKQNGDKYPEYYRVDLNFQF